MKTPARLARLLVVHERRVDRALNAVKHCNEHLQNAEAERDTRHEHLRATRAERERELARQTHALGNGSSRPLSVTKLTVARSRLDWWSARVAERAQELATAESTLADAQLAAQRARLRYRQVQAKQQGLTHLLHERERAVARDRARGEEHDSDGRWAATTLQAAGTVGSKLG